MHNTLGSYGFCNKLPKLDELKKIEVCYYAVWEVSIPNSDSSCPLSIDSREESIALYFLASGGLLNSLATSLQPLAFIVTFPITLLQLYLLLSPMYKATCG